MLDTLPDYIKDFWPAYVSQHANRTNRRLHFVGNTNLFIWLAVALWRRSPLLLVWAVASSYTLAWIGHFVFERNVPATFRYPLRAALCDMLMYARMWQGTMDAEVERYAGR